MLRGKILLLLLLLVLAPLASAKQCPNTVNIAVRLDSQASPTTPMLADQGQHRVCVRSGGSVYFHRTGQGSNNGFGIFLKDGSWNGEADNNRLEFIAPVVNVETEKAYGITMPDADSDLDPIVIISPGFDD